MSFVLVAPMKKLHIALSTRDLAASVEDYSARLGLAPETMVEGAYALWRTPCLNFTVRVDDNCEAGALRHLGWEDADAAAFAEDTDVNGIVWERFSAQQQAEEINQIWPQARYTPRS